MKVSHAALLWRSGLALELALVAYTASAYTASAYTASAWTTSCEESRSSATSASAYTASAYTASACTTSCEESRSSATSTYSPESVVTDGALVTADRARLIGPGHATPDAARQNALCEGCHVEIARSWRSSRHADSFDNDAFSRAYAREPLLECRACHAPEADADSTSATETTSLGVGCVSCHVVDDEILAAPRAGPEIDAPHKVRREASFGSENACSGCHEFPFPGGDATLRSELSQETVSEHDDSRNTETCASCHMPKEPTGSTSVRSHAFASVRDPDAWKRAVRVSAERIGPSSIGVHLTLRDVGHALPTGDMLRRFRIRAEALGEDFSITESRTAFVGRSFAFVQGSPSRREQDDNRPKPGPVGGSYELVLSSDAAARTITLTVELERVLFGQRDDVRAIVDSSVEIARITLPPLGKASFHAP